MVAHGFGMTAACRLDTVTDRFAREGIASIAFDYRGFGASLGTPRQVLDLGMQREDYRAALRWARAQPELDADRLGLWGTSFSGGHVLSVAADEPDLAAVVAQVPFTDGPMTLRGEGVGDPDRAPAGSGRDDGDGDGPSTAAWARHGAELLALAARDAAGARLGRPPVYVPIAGELGSHAVIAGPGSEQALLSLVPDDVRFDNRVAARIALQMARDRPRERAGAISAPLLVCVMEYDRVTPPDPARAAAAAARRGEVRTFSFQHFQAYQDPWLTELLDAEVAWLCPHLDLAERSEA